MTTDLTKIAVRLNPNATYEDFAVFNHFFITLKDEFHVVAREHDYAMIIGSYDTFLEVCRRNTMAYVNSHHIFVLSEERNPPKRVVVNLDNLKEIVNTYNYDHDPAESLRKLNTDDLIGLLRSAQEELTRRIQGVL